MASSINSLLGSSGSTGTSGASSSSTDPSSGPSEEVFLQLLVSQIQNQDPLNPTDSTQFVSQLAQFSELEQVIAIRSDIETAMSDGASSNPAAPTDGSGTPSNSTDNSTTPSSAGASTNSIN